MTSCLLSPAGRFLAVSGAIAAIFVACGSRTGLLADSEGPGIDATVEGDGQRDVKDVTADGPDKDGHPLDVVTDCPDPSYCDPRDLSKIFKCGQAIYQCGSL